MGVFIEHLHCCTVLGTLFLETERAGEEWREGKRENFKQGSMPSAEPAAGIDLTTLRSYLS